MAVMEEQPSGVDWFVLALLIVSLVGNIRLGAAYRTAVTARAEVSNQLVRKLQVGAIVPPFQAKNLAGESVEIAPGADSRPTVLYVFATTCPWCVRNQANIRKLSEVASGFRFIGIALDASSTLVADYVTKSGMAFPVLLGPSKATVSAYALGGTPMTIVVDSNGRVLKVWTGVVDISVRQEMREFFSLRLPEGLEDTH